MHLPSFLHGKKAAIFDLDGTIVDNMRYHEHAFRSLAAKHGITLTDKDFAWMAGRKNKDIFAHYFGEETVEEHEKMANEKEEIYRQLFEPDITEVPGFLEFLSSLKRNEILLAIASSAPRENRIFIFKHLPIYDYFDTVVGAEDVTHGKPNPEIFLKAAQELDVDPKNCVVFEDAPNGVKAAKSASMSVVGILTTHTKDELHEADIVINNFQELLNTDHSTFKV